MIDRWKYDVVLGSTNGQIQIQDYSMVAAREINKAQARAMKMAVVVLMRQWAIKAVKKLFQRQGLKPQHMAHREIVAAADDYLANHRSELTAEAKAIVDRWYAEGVFGKRGGIRSRVR